MQNEVLLCISLICIYATVLMAYKFLNKTGLYIWVSIATILANIEVLIMVDAFGLEQTLGNILFASTFLVTDILSENHSEAAAKKAVKVGIFTNIVFILISRTWFMYLPSESDFVSEAIYIVFDNTLRIIFASLFVFATSQFLDVWLYNRIWEKTKKVFNNENRALWIRNNFSTLISQFVNAVLFTFLAFYGIYEFNVLISIALSSYIIFAFTSLLDTPIIYIAKKFKVV